MNTSYKMTMNEVLAYLYTKHNAQHDFNKYMNLIVEWCVANGGIVPDDMIQFILKAQLHVYQTFPDEFLKFCDKLYQTYFDKYPYKPVRDVHKFMFESYHEDVFHDILERYLECNIPFRADRGIPV